MKHVLTFADSPLSDHLIRPTLHSVFGEYIGDIIYDGTWVGRDSQIPNIDGIRLDLIQGMKEAGVAAIRWPGGCTADHYHWMDGVGPVRRKRLPYSEVQQDKFYHDFGTDEFMRLCELVGAEPILVANCATGTPEEFAAWVEYCNGDPETKYGSMRAENGHPEPYNVRTWSIGNTDENVWWASYNDPISYARDFRRFKTAVMGQNLTLIGLGLSLRHETPDWVEPCVDYITSGGRQRGADSLSVHHYIGGMKGRYHACGDAVDYSDEAYYFTLSSLSAYQADIDYHRKVIAEHGCPRYPMSICFDEWGLWHPDATDQTGFRQRQTMRDAIFAALSLHLFYRNSDIVHYAMETQYANVLQSLFETDGTALIRTPTFYVFRLFKDHMCKRLLPVSDSCHDSMLDSFASADDHSVIVTLVNKDLHSPKEISLTPPEGMRLDAADLIAPDQVRDQNTFSAPYLIANRPFSTESDHSFTLPPHSIARLRFIRSN